MSSIVVRQKRCGSDVKETLKSTDILKVPNEHLQHRGLDRSGRYYRVTWDDGAPIINVPAQMSPIVIVGIDRAIAL